MNAAFLTFLTVSLLLFAGCSADPPSDRAVQELFKQNRASFDVLHEMIQSDRTLVQIGVETHSELTAERYDAYVELLGTIGAHRISVSRYDDTSTEIEIYSKGNVAESLSVDIIFLTERPDPVVEDTVAATVSDNTRAFRELDKSWYIRRWHD
ncbi:MAG: hypothetical protein GY743_22270 [Planctomycetaceae bacterium]|nr:hypothetical protein [Planctomycetaceae bacterium]